MLMRYLNLGIGESEAIALAKEAGLFIQLLINNKLRLICGEDARKFVF